MLDYVYRTGWIKLSNAIGIVDRERSPQSERFFNLDSPMVVFCRKTEVATKLKLKISVIAN